MCRCKCVWWMVLEWNVFEDVVRSMGFDLYSSQHQEDLRLHVHGEGGRRSLVKFSYVAVT